MTCLPFGGYFCRLNIEVIQHCARTSQKQDGFLSTWWLYQKGCDCVCVPVSVSDDQFDLAHSKCVELAITTRYILANSLSCLQQSLAQIQAVTAFKKS